MYSVFGGLGQLYRVKVWAVSGPNISRALVCIPVGQCREEGGRQCLKLGLGDIDFFCVSRYLRRVSRYTRYIGGIQIIGNQSYT